MKFTAQEEYGLRCILSLVRNDLQASGESGDPADGAAGASEPASLTISDMARSEGLTIQYAGKLIRILRKAGLVESARGRKGGYRLARSPDRITVAETLAALGGRIFEPYHCERFAGDRSFCVHTNDCSIRSLWSGLQMIVDRILSGMTLKDLVSAEKTMAEWMGSQGETISAFHGAPAGMPGQLVSVIENFQDSRRSHKEIQDRAAPAAAGSRKQP